MNRLTLGILSFACGLLCASRLAAQEVDHSVVFPKGDAAWSVAFPAKKPSPVPSPAAEASPPSVATNPDPIKTKRRIDIVTQGNLRRDTLTWSDGTSTDRWWTKDPAFILFENKSGGHVSSMPAANLAAERYDATSFNWVSAKTYQNDNSAAGKACQYYEMEVVEIVDGAQVKRTLKAWIDKKTHEPAAYDNGFGLALLTFSTGPVPSLSMPSQFAQKAERLKEFFTPPKKNGP